MWIDSADWNGRNQASKNRKFARTQFAIKNLRGESVGYQRQESGWRPDGLHIRRRIRAALAQEIDGAERKRTILKSCTLLSKHETPLLPSLTEAREHFGRTIEHLHRISPQTKMWVGGKDPESLPIFRQRSYVIRNDAKTLASERCRRCRLSCSFRAHKYDTAILKSHRARVQAGHAAQPQQKPQYRPQQIRKSIAYSRSFWPTSPDRVSSPLQPEFDFVVVHKVKKSTVRSLPDLQAWIAGFIRVGADVGKFFRINWTARLGPRRKVPMDF